MVATQDAIIDPFLSEEFFTNPAAVVARMRASDPVHPVQGLSCWMVTCYDDVKRLFTDPLVTNDRRAFRHYQEPEDEMARWSGAIEPVRRRLRPSPCARPRPLVIIPGQDFRATT